MGNLADYKSKSAASQLPTGLGSSVSTVRTGNGPLFSNAPEKRSAQVANVLNNPTQFTPQAPKSVTKSWLAALFDTTDSADNPVEFAWDNMLKGVGWAYDRANQAAVTAVSALPGGIQTLGWNQANDVSLGQAVVGSVMYDYNALMGNRSPWGEFDITNANDRKRVFEDNLVGKITSGAVDFGVMMFADPYMIIGKAAKIGRIKYFDSAYTSEKLADAVPKVVDQIANRANVAAKDMHPLASLSIFATTKNATGQPIRTLQEIMSHPVMDGVTNPEDVAATLMSADSPEQGFTAIRYMMGDISVRETLAAERPDLLMDISTKQTERLQLQLRHQPKKQAKLLQQYDDAMAKAHYEAQQTFQAERRGQATIEQLNAARARMDKAVEDYRLVRDMKLPDPIAQMSQKEAGIRAKEAQSAIDMMVQRDKFFQRLLADEEANVNTLAGVLNNRAADVSWLDVIPGRAIKSAPGKSLSSDTALGRRAEMHREKVALAKGQQEQTRGQWKTNYFGTGVGSRIINLHRWLGNENPSGYIVTDGVGAQNSYREMAASLNSVHALSGNAREVIDIKTVTRKTKNGPKTTVTRTPRAVGGIVSKDTLLRSYVDTWATGGALDQVARHNMLESFERNTIKHLGEYYGIDEKVVETLVDKMMLSRKNVIQEVKNNRGYWVEEGKVNKAPFLESQLRNGMYMLNFRAIEKEFQRAAETGFWKQKANGVADFSADHFANLYDEFQALWRPSVLLRLGYTQRNVLEGLIRSTAFMFSLDPKGLGQPIMDALRQGKYGLKNAVAPKWTEKAALAIESGKDSKRYAVWLDAQHKAAADAVNRAEAQIVTFSERYHDAVAMGETVEIRRLQKQLDYLRSLKAGALESQAALQHRPVALALFRQQGATKMRVFSGETTVAGHVLEQAFANDQLSQVYLANLSSAGTRQFEAGVAMQGMNGILKDHLIHNNKAVGPDDTEHYFKAVHDVIQQFMSDDVGRMIISGDSDKKIASYLMNTAPGRERAAFLEIAVPKGEKGFKVDSWDEAIDYARKMTSRFHDLVPSDELRTLIKEQKPTEEAVRTFLEGRKDLIPVVGDITQELAHSNLLNVVKKITSKGFKWLGTIPEDAFVRVPFYGRRHSEHLSSLMEDFTVKNGGYMTVAEINNVQRMAHMRALQDTKKWLYTIERRTNLGRVGEHIFPFISATQNSVTTFGRLIWNDPRVGVTLVRMWQAPEKMHIEDGDGNIVLAFPLDLVPSGIKERFGLDDMMNMKISKQGLNVIFQMSNGTPFPSAGPLVTIPASEMMKSGFMSSVDAPSALTFILGGNQEKANGVWDAWKGYLFGDSGLSEKIGSYDMLLPPWMQKMIQMKEGELNSVQYATQYALQMRTEYAKFLAGYREAAPTADEIKNRTNNLYWLRIFNNFAAFTPPQYTSKLQPLIDAIRTNKQSFGLDGDRMNSELFGDYLTMLGDFSITKNIAGAQANDVVYSNSRKYESLVGKIAPEIGDDLNTLGIILNNGNVTNALYDPSVSAWQQSTNIPGVTDKYRMMQSPQQAMIESQKNAGWVAYIKSMDVLDSILRQRGLKSYRVAGAADLASARQQLIQRLANDPSYGGWYSDYISFGSTKTVNAVKVITAAIGDQKFMKDNGGTGMWQAAQQYLAGRSQMLSGAISQMDWDGLRSDLLAYNTDWAAVANRYLTNDDDPIDIGVSFGTMGG